MKALIEPTTVVAEKRLSISAGMRVTVSAGKLQGAETVVFKLDEDDVATLGELYQNGDPKRLTATHNAVTIPGPIDVIVEKSTTAAAVGVYVVG
jgi:hypothetical protein